MGKVTPRSDEAICRYTGGEPVTFPQGLAYVVPLDFARTLERENAELRAKVDDLALLLKAEEKAYRGATDRAESVEALVAQLKARDENAAMLEAKLDAIAKELGHPAGAWKIAGCDVLAHYVRDTVANCRRFYESADAANNKLRDLIILCRKNGLEVTAFECDAARRTP